MDKVQPVALARIRINLLSGESSISNLILNLVPMVTGLLMLFTYFSQDIINCA